VLAVLPVQGPSPDQAGLAVLTALAGLALYLVKVRHQIRPG
jgi:hypothetical protein